MANNRNQYSFQDELNSNHASFDALPTSIKPDVSLSQSVDYSKNNKRKQDNNSDNDRPVKKGRYKKIYFSGNYADQYEKLYEYIKNHSSNEQRFNDIGKVANGKMLFSQHPVTKTMATIFLNKFWEDEANRQFLIDQHHSKYNDSCSNTPLPSKCISFISLTLDNQKYCLVAVSYASVNGYNAKSIGAKPKPTLKELNERVVACAKQLNQQDNLTGVKYLFITEGFQENYMNLLRGISDYSPKYKSCSEKTLGIALVKLFNQYGRRMFITGQANYAFYPYERDKYYGNHPQSIDPTVYSIKFKDSIQPLANNLLTLRRPCCDTCLTHKNAMFQVWHAAQTLGDQNQNVNQKQDKESEVLLSPLHHSIKQEFSSLLPEMSFFAQSPNAAPHTSVSSANNFFSASTSASTSISKSGNNQEIAPLYAVREYPSAPRTPEVFKEFYYEDGSKITVTEDYQIVEFILMSTTESNQQQIEPFLEFYDCVSPPSNPNTADILDQDNSIKAMKLNSTHRSESNDVGDDNGSPRFQRYYPS